MYKITRREVLVNNVYVFDVEAPAIARKARAGQFVILRVDDRGERIPVTIADFDREQGTVTIVFMAVGTTTRKLALMQEGETLPTFVGPLGNPTHIEDFGHDGKKGKVVCIGGGVGTATIFPVARAFHEAGNHVITIAGWRMKDLIFWEDRLRAVSDELIVCTDDGSVGRKGVVTVPLKEMLEAGIARKESRGAHSRPYDFPERDDESFLKHSLVRWVDGRPKLGWKPVTITRWQPAARTY